jgi:hypothetical protein
MSYRGRGRGRGRIGKGDEEEQGATGEERDVYNNRKKLADIIEIATTSPLLHLEDRALSSIKSIVRASDSNVNDAFDFLFDRLKKNHSQVGLLPSLPHQLGVEFRILHVLNSQLLPVLAALDCN